MKLRFDKTFFAISMITLSIGLLIFLLGEGFIRNYIGDVVVVIFLYSLLSTFISAKIYYRAGLIISVATLIEIMQSAVVFPANQLFEMTLGNNFDIYDLFAYVAGITIIVSYEILLLDSQRKR